MYSRTLLCICFAVALSACQGTTTANTNPANPAEAKQRIGNQAVIDHYAAGDFVAAYKAIPDRNLARRLYNSELISPKPPVEREKWVAEEFICMDLNRCDVVTGKPAPKRITKWVVKKKS